MLRKTRIKCVSRLLCLCLYWLSILCALFVSLSFSVFPFSLLPLPTYCKLSNLLEMVYISSVSFWTELQSALDLLFISFPFSLLTV